VSGPSPLSDWRRLFRIAQHLIEQVNSDAQVIGEWTLGGGTAMMLQIDHRESHDIDIFLADPQLLPFFNPATHDFEFEIMPSEYTGDGSGFLKLAFEKIGEIDFIVAPALTNNPIKRTKVEGVPVLLETVPEIITKKIFHRGATIKPRDIFDIAAAETVCRDEVILALKRHPDRVNATLQTMDKLQPDFVQKVISQLMIRDPFRHLVETALNDTKSLLRTIVS